ncbi:MAG TPA: UvrD-helicase domain-containing protein [Candidatus Acidoferrum sp.]|nr:UvrD-helicase domain-containing protein [Candidatus Acidoferrum sp.]
MVERGDTVAELLARFAAARREIVSRDFASMNPEQRRAVLAPDGAMLILAGAGSGKTTVLVNRIAYLIKYGNLLDTEPAALSEAAVSLLEEYAKCPDPDFEEHVLAVMGARPVRPWRILAVTFTNKAAGELRERLVKKIGPGGAEVAAGTFHSICAKMLRRDADKLGYPTDFTIYDADDAKKVMKECVKSAGLDDKKFPAGAMLSVIGRAKDTLQSPEAFAKATESDYRLSRISKVYELYQRKLKSAGAMDFDDLIFNTVRLLQEHPDVREAYRRRYDYVLVDEYQDTSRAQFILTELLAEGGGNIMVVGDDDQSIYSFRGATIENILSFESRHPDCTVIKLEQNYRSTGTILACANSAISRNTSRKGKNLWTSAPEGEKVGFFRGDDAYAEAQFIADQALAMSAAGRPYNDFAVLYRTNAQSAVIEETLIKSGLPYRIFGGMKFYERKEVKDVVAYLTALVNKEDTLRIARIINEPKRGIGEATVETLTRIAAAEGATMLEIAAAADAYADLSRAAAKLKAFAVMIAELTEFAGHALPTEVLAAVLEKTGYLDYVRAQDTADGRDRTANIGTLSENVAKYEESDPEPTIAGFLEGAALATDLDAYDEAAGYVSLMTIHSAKGLEFPIVFLTGMEEELFPSGRVLMEPKEMEEERRLCYVAITRAKSRLFLTCAAMRRMFSNTLYPQPSRFLKEIPQQYIEDMGEQKRKERAGVRVPWDLQALPTVPKAVFKPAPQQAAVKYEAGDLVRHGSFGAGRVLSVKETGGDQLLEIDFGGTVKKLMANYAAKMLKKEG